jgi:hypothetical protein
MPMFEKSKFVRTVSPRQWWGDSSKKSGIFQGR